MIVASEASVTEMSGVEYETELETVVLPPKFAVGISPKNPALASSCLLTDWLLVTKVLVRRNTRGFWPREPLKKADTVQPRRRGPVMNWICED